jgi:dTDP-4-dehydrorhamnose reductase
MAGNDMTAPKILLFGANGQVGSALQRSLAPLGEVIALHRSSTLHCGDLSQIESIQQTVSAIRPDVIVNAAAYTAVDKAETETEPSRLINATAPAALAEAAKQVEALLVHYSTDYVFDGSGARPWLETDTPAPLNHYGLTKWEGEQAINHSGCRHLIFRTSWVYGAGGQHFIRTMLRLACERAQLRVNDDQVGAPTGADLIADVTPHTIRAVMQNSSLSGTYHLAPSGEISWYDYARYVISQAKPLRPDWDWKVQELMPIPTEEYPTPAKRPLNSRLNTTKLEQAFTLHMPPWQAGVDQYLRGMMEAGA